MAEGPRFLTWRRSAASVLWAALLVIVALLPWRVLPAEAASCHGADCTGFYAPGKGCDTDAQTGPAQTFSGGNRVENRYSPTCDAEWERTRNLSGGSRYAAGSIRYGCANYCYAQSVSSPGAIANGQQVYTPMMGPDGATPAISCGQLATSGPIGTPVTSPCTSVS